MRYRQKIDTFALGYFRFLRQDCDRARELDHLQREFSQTFESVGRSRAAEVFWAEPFWKV